MLGGIGAPKPAEIGAATEYVLKKAPCRVLLTAPPEAPESTPGGASEPADCRWLNSGEDPEARAGAEPLAAD